MNRETSDSYYEEQSRFILFAFKPNNCQYEFSKVIVKVLFSAPSAVIAGVAGTN